MHVPTGQCLFLSALCLLAAASAAQQVETLPYSEAEKRWRKDNDTTYVVSFWATWCAPCIREMPHFEKVQADYSGRKLKVLLVSLDFRSQVQERLLPFIAEKGLLCTVIHLHDPDANAWIPKVDESWTGSIPATLIVNGRTGYRKFFEKELTLEELEKALGPVTQ